MFRVKDFLSIVSGMVAHMRAVNTDLTDYNVGAIARTMVEAPAIELDEMYQMIAAGLVEAIPTAIYSSFDFALQPAVAASGLVRISAIHGHSDPVVLPVGFLVGAANGVQYALAQQATIPVGADYVDALVVATVPGLAGNAAAGTVQYVISGGTLANGATNQEAISNGKGAETPDERKLRFQDFVRTLARGTPAAVAYACKLAQLADPTSGVVVERVARVTLDETAGHVYAYVHNGVGGTSAALVQRAADLVEGYTDPVSGALVPGYRPTGMRVDVLPMSEQPVNVTLNVQAVSSLQSDATKARLALAVGGVIRATVSGQSLRPVDMVNAVLVFTGILGAEIVTPTLFVPCPASSVLVPGTITIAWA